MAKSSLPRNLLVRLHNEIRMSKKRNESELEGKIRRNIARYTGIFIPEIAVDWDIVLNEIYPIVQFNLPATFYRNPRVFLKPRSKNFVVKRRNLDTLEMEEVFMDSQKSATTQEAILNYTISEIQYKQETRKVLFDALVATHGVLWHGYKGEFGMTEEQSLFIKSEQVFVKRISPLRFLFDPAVNLSNIDEARWIARSFDVAIEDLLDDPDLNVDKKSVKGKLGFGERVASDELLAQMKTGGQDKLQSGRLKPLIEFTDSEYRDSMMSKFVTLYEVFLRPTKKESRSGEKGRVILLSEEQFEELRVNKWPYKAEGWPAQILAFNDIPDAMFPLDDVSTYEQIADNKNAIRNLQLRNAKENSKVWVALAKDGTNQEDIIKVQNGDQTIVLFEGDTVTGKMSVASAGAGASSELYTIDQRIDRELQDKSGVTDLKKGFLQSGEESAASVQLRAAGGSVRPQYRQDIMADFLKASFHYLNQLLKQFVPVKEAVRITGSLDVQWSDNPTKEEVQADTDVEIDVISMLPENPEKEIQELTTVLKFMSEALQVPVLYQKLQQEGYTISLVPVLENLLIRLKIRNPEVLRRIREDETMGFVSVTELKAAQANVEAAMQGQPPVSPPAPGQDHRARLEVYSSAATLLQQTGQLNELLMQLIQIQGALLQEEMAKQSPQAGQQVNMQRLRPAEMMTT